MLAEIVINEFLEFVVPLAFLFSLLAAYYGPNSTLFGGIGSDIWHYESIQDMSQTSLKILMFFFADLTSIAVVGAMIWRKIRTNAFKALALLLQEFAFSFCAISSLQVYFVSIKFIM